MTAPVSNTPYGIIYDAYHDAGLLGLGEEPNSEQLTEGMRRLCDVINLWQTQGLKLFLLEDFEITLIANQASYSMGLTGDIVMAKPSRILQAYILLTDGLVRRPLVSLSWDEWMRLSQVSGNQGQISSYFVNKQSDLLTVTFWNTPDTEEALNTAHVLLQRQVDNPINLEADMMFPAEWRIALRWGLADDLATGQPEAIMTRCAQRAGAFREALEDWDVEDTVTRFSIDQRMTYGYGKFQ